MVLKWEWWASEQVWRLSSSHQQMIPTMIKGIHHSKDPCGDLLKLLFAESTKVVLHWTTLFYWCAYCPVWWLFIVVFLEHQEKEEDQEGEEAYQEDHQEEEALPLLPYYGGYLTQATPATVLISCSSTQSLQEGPLAPPRGDPATPPSLIRSLHLQDLLEQTIRNVYDLISGGDRFGRWREQLLAPAHCAEIHNAAVWVALALLAPVSENSARPRVAVLFCRPSDILNLLITTFRNGRMSGNCCCLVL